MKIKIAIVSHSYKVKYHFHSVCAAFDKIFDVSWKIVDNGWPTEISDIFDYKKQEAVIWLVGFKHLRRKAPFDWKDYTGKRIMYDVDVCQNYGCGVGTSNFKGKWPEVFRRQKFDILVCTGKKTTEALKEEGIDACWIPKAFGSEIFYNKKRKRKKSGICYYGNLYPERRIMKDFLTDRGFNVHRVNCNYFLLNSLLNMYKACVVYNGIEPMIKQFEIAASGCVPFCNEIPELFDLGFEDGKTMVSYKTFEELAEKLIYYFKQSDKLYKIGETAARLAKKRHSWLNRMEMFKEII